MSVSNIFSDRCDAETNYEEKYDGAFSISFGKDLPDGTYQLVQMSRKAGTEEWHRNILSNTYYLKVTISGNQANIKPVTAEAIKVNYVGFQLKDNTEYYQIVVNVSNADAEFLGDIYIVDEKGNMVSLTSAFAGRNETTDIIVDLSMLPDADNISVIVAGTQQNYTLNNTKRCWTDFSKGVLFEATPDIVVPDSALAVDLRDVTFEHITPSKNPNCVYYLNSSLVIPENLKGKNIVQNNICHHLDIQEGYGFYAPLYFVAEEAVWYWTLPNSNNWETLFAPFDVQKVFIGSEQLSLSAFSEDIGKDLMAAEFVTDVNNTLIFKTAPELKKNTAYLYRVNEGIVGKIGGQTASFQATNVDFDMIGLKQTGEDYVVAGTVNRQHIGNAYILHEGQMENVESASVEPLSAYFVSSKGNQQPSIRIDDGMDATGKKGNLTIESLITDRKTYLRDPSSGNFKDFMVLVAVGNYTEETIHRNPHYPIALYKDGNVICPLYTCCGAFPDIDGNSGLAKPYLFEIPSSIPDGEYILSDVIRYQGETKYFPPTNYDLVYANITIKGDSMTVKSYPNDYIQVLSMKQERNFDSNVTICQYELYNDGPDVMIEIPHEENGGVVFIPELFEHHERKVFSSFAGLNSLTLLKDQEKAKYYLSPHARTKCSADYLFNVSSV